MINFLSWTTVFLTIVRFSLEEFGMLYCTLIVALGLPKLGYTFWPASYRVDLDDRKTFVITAGEDSDAEDEETENEMIQPEDLADLGSLVDDEERYRPLHSHVEHYNRRAAESAARLSEAAQHFQPNFEERNSADDEEPYIAGFKHELDKYDFDRTAEDVSSRRKRHDSGTKSADTSKRRSKRKGEDIFAFPEDLEDMFETMSPRDHSPPPGENADHATPHPDDSSDSTLDSSTPNSEDYTEEHTSISYERPTSGELEKSGSKESSDRGFVESEVETTQASLEEAEEEAYDYEKFRAEYDQQIEDAKISNMTFNYTDSGEPEETAGDAIKKIVEFDVPKNCTKEELTQFGVKALECLAFDYQNARNQSDVRRILARTWSVVRVWICIYVSIAVPCWCQKGWCCCCFRCSMCFPEDRIFQAKHYYAENPPGVLVDQPRKKGEPPEPIKYKPTLFEIDAYEQFESAIRNL